MTKLNEDEFSLLEIQLLKAIVQPHRDNKISGKFILYWKAIDHKLDLMAKKRAKAIGKEIEKVTSAIPPEVIAEYDKIRSQKADEVFFQLSKTEKGDKE